MTPQERAAVVYATLSCVLYNEGHHDADQDIAVLAEALQTTRRATLLEAAQVAQEHRDTGDRYTSGNRICVALARLAQEG